MNKTGIAILLATLGLGFAAQGNAQERGPETVSFRCVLAFDAVLAELDRQAENPVTQQALERIDEDNGQFVCVRANDRTIVVRLQPPDLAPTEGRLIFTVDPATYRVMKTYFGP